MARRAPALGLALAALLGSVLVLGCGQSAGDARTVVRFWAFGREGEVVRELVPAFERRHPQWRVEVQQVPWTAAHEKLLTAFVGGTMPDAAQLGNSWIPEFVALGALAPLDARLPGTIPVEDFFAGIWETNVLDGQTWGVPWYVDTRLLFYRRDLLAQAGYPEPPRTWAEWRAAMVAVKALGPDRYAILLPIDEWAQPVILAMQAGSELLREDGTRGAFADPRFRRAMAFYLDLYASGLAPPLTLSGLSNLYQQFAEGYFAMVITGPWNLGEFRRRLPEAMQDRWATAPLPAPDEASGGPGVSLAGGSSLVLFRSTRASEAAWSWLAYLAEPEQQARFHELTGNLPARRSVWEATGLASEPRTAAFAAQLAAVRATPKVPEWEQIATKIADHAEAVMRGARTLDEGLAALDRDVDRILEKRRWLRERAATGRRSD